MTAEVRHISGENWRLALPTLRGLLEDLEKPGAYEVRAVVVLTLDTNNVLRVHGMGPDADNLHCAAMMNSGATFLNHHVFEQDYSED